MRKWVMGSALGTVFLVMHENQHVKQQIKFKSYFYLRNLIFSCNIPCVTFVILLLYSARLVAFREMVELIRSS